MLVLSHLVLSLIPLTRLAFSFLMSMISCKIASFFFRQLATIVLMMIVIIIIDDVDDDIIDCVDVYLAIVLSIFY